MEDTTTKRYDEGVALPGLFWSLGGASFFPPHSGHDFCQGRWQVHTLAEHTTPMKDML
jgi:hypothetical protein